MVKDGYLVFSRHSMFRLPIIIKRNIIEVFPCFENYVSLFEQKKNIIF